MAERPLGPQIWLALPETSGGWAPVTAMAELLAEFWAAELRVFTPRRLYSRPTRAASLVPRLRGRRPPLLIIAAHPGLLLSLARPSFLAGRFARVGAWIIDSFWDDRLPRFARTTQNIDHIWVTDGELVDGYAQRTQAPVDWAPWGADVLGRIGADNSADRPVDLLRLGRQPDLWKDDDANRAWAACTGLAYQGRFPAPDGARENHQAVLTQLSRAKIVLSSSNLVDRAEYTHPTREYVTARFTDAVACGTLIAGRLPRCQALEVIPQIARLEIDINDREDGGSAIVDAARSWTPEQSAAIQHAGLMTTDWRWRFRSISDALEVESLRLDSELARLRELADA